MIYIDNYNAPFRRMIMCHLFADTKDELLDIVNKIGVNPKWIQKENTPEEHFDICLSKKKLALKHGAIEVSPRKFVEIVRSKRLMLNCKTK